MSGVVPTLLSVYGACVSGPALALGCFDQVVMTDDAFAFVTGPDSIADFTGESVTRTELGGSAMHDRRTGVAALVVPDEDTARTRSPRSFRTSRIIISPMPAAVRCSTTATARARWRQPRFPNRRARRMTFAP